MEMLLSVWIVFLFNVESPVFIFLDILMDILEVNLMIIIIYGLTLLLPEVQLIIGESGHKLIMMNLLLRKMNGDLL